ncbi:unnamed protein product, partial [Choristocarpus tenellus]
ASTDDGGEVKSNSADGEKKKVQKDEVRFGKHLASSDKRVRDKTLSSLREWLHKRSAGGVLSDIDLLKIWRGLWYCMFMCDKAHIQLDLANNLAGLLHLFREDKVEGVRFLQAFCITMQRDWGVIDYHRMDKFLSLVRLFFRETIRFCISSDQDRQGQRKKKRRKKPSRGKARVFALCACFFGVWLWDREILRSVISVLEEEVIACTGPSGLRLFLAEVWVEELCRVGGDNITTEVFLDAIAPWLRVAASPATNDVLFGRTMSRVLEEVLKYFPTCAGGGEESEMEVDKEGGGEDTSHPVFKVVDLSALQACVFEVAAAEQVRQWR